jgi:ribonucleoside-diphosphate reductase alpha chain
LDLAGYEHAVRLYSMVLEISVHMASFPSKEIALGSYNYRTLGLGYANLGGLLMRIGIPYDSDEGRSLAAAITALMTGVAYKTSAEMANEVGPFPRWEANKESMRRILYNHAMSILSSENRVEGLSIQPYRPDIKLNEDEDDKNIVSNAIASRAYNIWCEGVLHGAPNGFRNAQTTLIAPTGTISFVMDCDTTGIEPDFGLVKHKSLAGGGHMKIVNQGVESALRCLGYDEDQISSVIKNIEYCGSVSGFAWKDCAHEAVFACANDIDPMGHVKMVAAVQPFLSGAVSKTINMPHESTVEDVSDVYMQSWKLGLKAVAIYRDGSKLTQPYASQKKKKDPVKEAVQKATKTFEEQMMEKASSNLFARRFTESMQGSTIKTQVLPNGHAAPNGNGREMLPWRREKGFTQKVKIDGQSVYLHVGEYEDGRPGEIFLELAKQGSTLRGMGNLFAISVSIGLQHGVPVREYIKNFLLTKFEPAGIVEGHKHIKMVSSIADYVARELAITYLHQYDLANDKNGLEESLVEVKREAVGDDGNRTFFPIGFALGSGRTGGVCPDCSNATLVQNGTCVSCSNCSYNTGCG